MRRSGLKRKILWRILETNNLLVLTDFIIAELRANFTELYSARQARIALDLLLQFLSTGRAIVKTKEVYTPLMEQARMFVPKKDTPVLAAAMLEEVDLLITWDAKHFLNNEALMNSPWGKKIKHPDDLLKMLR